MIGYIVTEPNLRIERVPDHLLSHEHLLWPADRNVIPEKEPGARTVMFNATDLYRRASLRPADVLVYVWSQRDANALPESVVNEIRELAKRDAPIKSQ